MSAGDDLRAEIREEEDRIVVADVRRWLAFLWTLIRRMVRGGA